MAHSRKEILIQEAGLESVDSKELLAQKGLDATREKSANMPLLPNETLHGFFRRTPNGHQAAAMELKKREKVLGTAEDTSSDDGEMGDHVSTSNLPYTRVTQLKILGVTFHRKMGFTTHIGNAIDIIGVRQSSPGVMGGSTWGSESNILRVTHKVLLESVVGYGFVAMGSGAYEKD